MHVLNADVFWSKVDRSDPDGCWPWKKGHTTAGYGETWNGTRVLYSHRVAWELTYGPIPPKMEIMHTCDTPPCCRPDHLVLGTHRQNLIDAWEKGIVKQPPRMLGINHPNAKLTEEAVRAIRIRKQAGETLTALAAEFNISLTTASRVYRRVIWSHVS